MNGNQAMVSSPLYKKSTSYFTISSTIIFWCLAVKTYKIGKCCSIPSITCFQLCNFRQTDLIFAAIVFILIELLKCIMQINFFLCIPIKKLSSNHKLKLLTNIWANRIIHSPNYLRTSNYSKPLNPSSIQTYGQQNHKSLSLTPLTFTFPHLCTTFSTSFNHL